MLQIARTENNKSSSVIHKVNYTQLYNQLKVLLPGELISLFAKPDIGDNYTIWTSDEFSGPASIKSFSALSEKEKNLAAGEIEDKKDQILSVLSGHPVLGPMSEQLFFIAEEDDIKWISDGANSTVVLCRWGSKSNLVKTAVNPLTTVINRPGNNRSEVTVRTKYNDGDYASEINISVEYKGNIKNYQTNEYGEVQLGRFLHGSNIKIFFIFGNEKRYQHQFTVDERTHYDIKIPKTGDAVINVVNQDGKSIPGCDIELEYKGSKYAYKTNENGTLVIEHLEYREILEVFAEMEILGTSTKANAQLKISDSENKLTLVLKEPRPANLSIKTIDQFDNPISTNISIAFSGKVQEFTTDEEGELKINGLYELGQSLNIKATDFNHELKGYVINEKENEIILKLSVPEPKFIIVKLLDFKKQLLPGTKIDFASQNINESRTTNEASLCNFNIGDFNHNEKVKTKIYYPKKKKNGNLKTVIYKKTFRYDENQHEFILQLNKRNWWWLLLLLIPLLLIQCEKQIPVKIIYAENSAPIKSASTTFEYNRQNLFRPWALFAVDPQKRDSISNDNGTVTYKKVKYSIYSLIFYNLTNAKFTASCECYQTDTVNHYFHYLPDTVKLRLIEKRVTHDFLVVDKQTQNPLDSAWVYIEYLDEKGNRVIDTLMTDNKGKVNKDFSFCANDLKVIGRKENYSDDAIHKNRAIDFQGDLYNKRKLELDKPQNAIPCNSVVNSGGQGVTTNEYYIGRIRNFILDYDFYSVKDKLIIYCGKKDEKSEVIINTGFVNGRRSIQVDLNRCKSDWITVEVTGLNGTDWRYRVICP